MIPEIVAPKACTHSPNSFSKGEDMPRQGKNVTLYHTPQKREEIRQYCETWDMKGGIAFPVQVLTRFCPYPTESH